MLDEKDLKPTDTNPSEENTSSEGTSKEQNQTPSVYTNQNTFGSYSMTQEQKDQYDAFQHLSDQEKLWFFIDDMVPTDTTDTSFLTRMTAAPSPFCRKVWTFLKKLPMHQIMRQSYIQI